jgi:uncharacterized protein (DUF2267 family)
MTYEQMIELVQKRAGFASVEEAERAVRVTVCTLGERLMPEEALALAEALPDPLAAELRRTTYGGEFDLAEFYDRIARREGLRVGFGVEHAQAACQVIGEALPIELRERLQKHLPAFAPLLEAQATEHAPPRPSHQRPAVHPGAGRTLASGRPGSTHPLSEAQPDRAHSQSVARTPNPHEDTKVSSSRGMTQERFDETLATGKPPGPKRPVSETED